MIRPRSLPVPLPRLPVRRWARRARRSPAVWWSAAAATALSASIQVAAAERDAARARSAWGDPVTVVVAVHPLGPGDVVGPGDVTIDRWPLAVVPSDAADGPVDGRAVTAPIVAGEVVVEARLAPDGLSAVAARIPPGHRAVAVPTAAGGYGTEAPPVAVGDRVDVLATFDVVDGDAPPTAPVASAALVVDVGDDGVTVAVPDHDAGRVAFAVARGTVTLALVGGR